MHKLPARHFHLVFSLLMGSAMVPPVTLIVTLVNVGPVPDFLARRGRACAAAGWVAVPVLYFLGPRVRRLTGRLVETPTQSRRLALPAHSCRHEELPLPIHHRPQGVAEGLA